MADMTLTTLTGSPRPAEGVSLLSRRKRHACRIPSLNWKERISGSGFHLSFSLSLCPPASPVPSLPVPARSSRFAPQSDSPCHNRSFPCPSGCILSSRCHRPCTQCRLRKKKRTIRDVSSDTHTFSQTGVFPKCQYNPCPI